MLKAVLQGRPLGHPLHPALVHLPIGLFVFSLLLDLASFVIADGNPLVRGAYAALALGLVTAVIAAIPGLAEWVDIRADHPAKRTATRHMVLNLVAIAIFAVSLFLRGDRLGEAQSPLWPVILSAAGVAILSLSGYLGGSLVYDDGIAVGRHRRRTATPERTVTVESTGPDGFVPVADVGSLDEGATLRVAVDGTVMTLARVDGEYVAFQEFCSHRFGPLSEGRLIDGDIECPWHRSRFDMRTGKVTQGPAKVDLKVFPVLVRDGKLYVSAGERFPAAPGEP